MAVKYNPYGGSNRSGKTGGYSPYPSGYGTKSGSSALTGQQMLALLKAQQTHHSESFVDRIKHAGSSGLHGVSWTFDKLLRPEYAIATAIDQGVGKHGSLSGALHGAVKGFKGKGDHGFGEVLAHHNVLSGHGRLRGALGFALDVAADPLTYVSGGTGSFLAKGAEHGALIKAGRVALSSSRIDHASLDGMKLAADQLAHGGASYTARRALASEQAGYMEKILANKSVTDLDKGKLATLREAAKAEENSVEQKLPQYSIGVGKHKAPITPTHVAGKRVVPALPKLDNFIARGGMGSKMAEKYRDLFIRSPHTTPVTHALNMTHQHLGEEYNDEMLKNIVLKNLSGHRLSEDQMIDALHHMESADKAVIKTKNGAYHLNVNHLQRLRRDGKISAEQESFIRSWHKTTQELYKRDKQFGIDYKHLGDKGQLYVPHRLVDKMGHPLADAQINKLTKAGFQHSRTTGKLSVKMLKELANSGKLGREVETNPYNLLVHTVRSRAQKQADMTVLHSVAPTFGTATRVVDEARLAKNLRGQQTLVDRMADTEGKHSAAMSAAHTKEQLFLDNHEIAHHQVTEGIQSQLRKIKYGPKTRTKAMNIGKLGKKLDRIQEAHAAETQAIANGAHEPLNALLKPHLEEAAQHANDIKNMQTEFKRLQQTEARLRVGKRNKTFTPGSMKTVSGAVDSHGHPIGFQPEIAHAMENYQKIVAGDDKAIQDFSRGWQKWVANWKLLVTSVNPGYRVRNTMSDVWGMYISGVPMSQVVHYGVVARNVMKAAKRGDPQAVETLREAYHHGILSGLFKGDVQNVGKMIARQGKAKTSLMKDGHYLQAAGKLSQDVNAHIENMGRITHYLYLRQSHDMSAADAAFRVKRAHFDYEDLTPFEQRRMKAIAPFYTWTRKNIPFQIKALAERPGRVLTFPKAAIESEQASGGDPGNIIPSYITNSMGFQIPFGKHNYYMPQIGIADLQALDSKAGLESRTTGLINPAFKLPLELMLNKNSFTGQPIKDTHSRNPVSSLGADLLSLIPGSNVGQTSRLGPGGKTLTGKGANPYYTYLLGQVPWANEALVKSSGIKRQQAGGVPPELSQILGQSVQHVDPKLQQQVAQINLDNQVKQQIKDLRDEGIMKPAKHKKSKKQNLIDQVLLANAGRR